MGRHFPRPAVTVICCLALFVAATFVANAADIASNDRIGFVRYKRGIFSMAGDGTKRRPLVHLVGPTSGTVWSPDGRRFLFVSGHHVKRPDRCDPQCPFATRGQRRWFSKPAHPRLGQWRCAEFVAGTGPEIVFVMDNTLSLIGADGRNLRPIPIRGAVGSPDWAADGHSIIFESIDGIVLLDTRTPRKQYRVLVDGTEPLCPRIGGSSPTATRATGSRCSTSPHARRERSPARTI